MPAQNPSPGSEKESAALPSSRSGKLLHASLFVAGMVVLLWAVCFVEFYQHTSAIKPYRGGGLKADGLVVLTGGSQRLEEGLLLLKEDVADNMLLTGVNQEVGKEDLIALSGEESRDIIDCCVELGYSATNTVGNAKEAARWVRQNGYKSIIIVTSNYHALRAKLEFRRQMPDINIRVQPVVPAGTEADSQLIDADLLKLTILEFNKLVIAYMGIQPRDTGNLPID